MRGSSSYSSSGRGLSLSTNVALISSGGAGDSRDGTVVPYGGESPITPLTPGGPIGAARDIGAGVGKGDVLPDDRTSTHPGDIKLDMIRRWDQSIKRSPQFSLAQTVLSRTSMELVLVSRQTEIADIQVFNTQVSTEGTPVANQLQSGRCWLFATTNVIRVFTARKHNLGDFQLSQSYLWFYDHVAKANWFLEQAIDLAEEPLSSRTNQYIYAGTETQDGGTYDLAVNLIMKYGLVPQTVYPESFNSSNSGQVDALVASKLREHALALRKLCRRSAKAGDSPDVTLRYARELKEEQLADIYRLLAICAGSPPEPNEQFVWEFRTKDHQFKRIVTTPLEFAHDLCGYRYNDAIALLNDPRNPADKLYTVQRLGNVVGGARQVRYVNADIKVLKQAAIDGLSANVPVWFGCDVEKAQSAAHGILDTALYSYDDAFGTSVKMKKSQRLESGDSSMTHAMMLTGVHIVDGKVIRWRVENLGPEACTKGFFCMSDDWFTQNVFQVVALREFIPKDLVRLYDNPNAPVTELPPWDPLGALAGRDFAGSARSATSAATCVQALMNALSMGGMGASSSNGATSVSGTASSAANAASSGAMGGSGLGAGTNGRAGAGGSGRSSRAAY